MTWESVYCGARTKDGRGCARKTHARGAYCWQHRRIAEEKHREGRRHEKTKEADRG